MSIKIVSFEPLAPEGSAEWAWQMLNLLGLPIYHPAEGVLTIPIPYSSERFAHCYAKTGWLIHKPVNESPKPPKEPNYVICKRCAGSQSVHNPAYSNTAYVTCPKCGGTGYEIDPEPEYKVGDWVEFIDAGGRKSQGKYLSNAYDNTILVLDIFYNMRCVVPTTKITRKLDPSEVIVKIGCLSGTIGKSCDLDRFLMWHSSPKIDFDYSIIKFSALDAPTREMVESLLKAQEEK